MTPVVTSPPATYPVGLAEVRASLAIEVTTDDARLGGLIAVATDLAEKWLGRSLITRSYRGFLDAPAWRGRRGRHPHTPTLELPRPPLISVESISTFTDDGTETTYDAANYYIDADGLVGRVALIDSASWPTGLRRTNSIQINWTAGYGLNPGDVPEVIRQAIIVAVGWLSEQRGDEGAPKEFPLAAQALLQSDTVYVLA